MKDQRLQRKKRIRAKVIGTKDMPRLSVFRSNKYVYAQIIDDEKGKTVVGVSEKKLKDSKINKTGKSKELGLLVAKLAIAKKIKNVVFDRSGYAYHGRIKAVAEGAREGGLKF